MCQSASHPLAVITYTLSHEAASAEGAVGGSLISVSNKSSRITSTVSLQGDREGEGLLLTPQSS